MSGLALGTVQLGLPYGIGNNSGQVELAEARVMLECARANGFDTLDTAIGYGESEARLGTIGTTGFRVVSKIPEVPAGTRNVGTWVKEEARGSLGRLRIQSHYGLLLHRPAQLLGGEGRDIYQALCDLKNAGLVNKIGISVYSPVELDELISRYNFDLVQAPFNIIDRRLSASGWLEKLRAAGIEVHTRSAFLQGLLLMPRHVVPTKFSPWSGLLERWHRWLEESGTSAVAACLAFLSNYPEIDRIVIGADSAAQLREIVTASKQRISPSLPEIASDDENLINPARWSGLVESPASPHRGSSTESQSANNRLAARGK